jgi:prephenate dehydratase
MTASISSPRVAFQGERGAFSEEAAVKLLGEQIDLVPRATFDLLYSSIAEGVADFIVAPIENSLAGSIHRAYDLLLESGLQIKREIIRPISHCLIGLPGSSLESITQVQSHPMALAQCERFFAEHPWIRRVATEDTAGSVRVIMHAGDPAHAAIAGRRAAHVYGASILLDRLEDHYNNYTRFLLLSPDPSVPDGADKLSIVVRLAHKPGTLHDALGVFAWRDLNLLKIESRPIPGRPWQYRFYLDIHASSTDPRTIGALAEIRNFVDDVTILGCYPQAPPLEADPLAKAREATAAP